MQINFIIKGFSRMSVFMQTDENAHGNNKVI